MQLVTRKLEKEEEEEEEEEGQEEAEEDAGEVERDEEEENEGDNEESAQEAQKVEKCHKPRVDDGFFSMSAMEEYLENADKLSDPGMIRLFHTFYDGLIRLRGQCGYVG